MENKGETVTVLGTVPTEKLNEFMNNHFKPKDTRPVERYTACGWCAKEFIGMKLKSCKMTVSSDGSTTIHCTYA
ncbi:MAG: hypothetical protein WAL34_04185 [Acidobacteriaceae bacterium]